MNTITFIYLFVCLCSFSSAENGKFQDIPQVYSELHVSYDPSIKIPSMKISEVLTTLIVNPTKQLSESIPAISTDPDMNWTPHNGVLHFATSKSMSFT